MPVAAENSRRGPARVGALICAKDLARLSAFYQTLLSMTLLHGDDEHHVLSSSDFQLIVHAMPPHIAATISIATPPQPREATAIKLFFSVNSLAEANTVVRELGGALFVQIYADPGFNAQNGYDLEGNIFHLREAFD